MLKAASKANVGGSNSDERCLQPCAQEKPDNFVVMDEDDLMKDRLLKIVHAVCEWLYPPRCQQSTVTLRAYAFVWFLRPEWLGNPTQATLAKRLNVSRQSIGHIINQLRDKFGFYVAGMRSTAAREKFARNAKRHAQDLAAARRKAYAQRKGRA